MEERSSWMEHFTIVDSAVNTNHLQFLPVAVLKGFFYKKALAVWLSGHCIRL
jgi:hypothetical protein